MSARSPSLHFGDGSGTSGAASPFDVLALPLDIPSESPLPGLRAPPLNPFNSPRELYGASQREAAAALRKADSKLLDPSRRASDVARPPARAASELSGLYHFASDPGLQHQSLFDSRDALFLEAPRSGAGSLDQATSSLHASLSSLTSRGLAGGTGPPGLGVYGGAQPLFGSLGGQGLPPRPSGLGTSHPSGIPSGPLPGVKPPSGLGASLPSGGLGSGALPSGLAASLPSGGLPSGLLSAGLSSALPSGFLAPNPSLSSLGGQGASLSSLGGQGANLSSLGNQGANLSSLGNQGASLSSLASQGAPLSALASQGASLSGLASQGASLSALASQGAPLSALAPHLHSLPGTLTPARPPAPPRTSSVSPLALVPAPGRSPSPAPARAAEGLDGQATPLKRGGEARATPPRSARGEEEASGPGVGSPWLPAGSAAGSLTGAASLAGSFTGSGSIQGAGSGSVPDGGERLFALARASPPARGGGGGLDEALGALSLDGDAARARRPSAQGAPPAQNRTLYLGCLHPLVSESLLAEVFGGCQGLTELKVVRDKTTGASAGYGFAKFETAEWAARALDAVAKPVLYGQEMRVNWAFSKEKSEEAAQSFAFVGDLSSEVTDHVLLSAFRHLPGCSDARVIWDAQTGRSRGYGFVAFCAREQAEAAIRAMQGRVVGSHRVRVGWAEHRVGDAAVKPLDAEALDRSDPTNTNVYVGNLDSALADADVRRAFGTWGALAEVKVYKKGAYGFVRYRRHEDAVKAIVGMNGVRLGDKVVKCFWGRHPQLPGAQPNVANLVLATMAGGMAPAHAMVGQPVGLLPLSSPLSPLAPSKPAQGLSLVPGDAGGLHYVAPPSMGLLGGAGGLVGAPAQVLGAGPMLGSPALDAAHLQYLQSCYAGALNHVFYPQQH